MYVVIAIIYFGLLIVVHEFGHFFVARLCGVQVNEFSVGMGPALIKKEKKGTLFSLRLIPFGGYCAMLGETEGEQEDCDVEHALFSQPIWKKLLIFIAGSFMNFLLGFLIIFVIVIIYNFGEAPFFVMVRHSWNLCIGFVKLVWESLQMLFTGEAGINDLSGPIGIVDVMADSAASAESVSDAVLSFCYIASLIAVNLSVMNMLPIPGLDGGHIFLMLVTFIIEKITRRKLNPKFEAVINAVGLVLMLGLMAYVMFQDIIRVFFNGGQT